MIFKANKANNDLKHFGKGLMKTVICEINSFSLGKILYVLVVFGSHSARDSSLPKYTYFGHVT